MQRCPSPPTHPPLTQDIQHIMNSRDIIYIYYEIVQRCPLHLMPLDPPRPRGAHTCAAHTRQF